MQLRFLSRSLLFVIASGLIAACQGGERTEFLMEVTVEVTRLVPVTVTPEPDTAVAQAAPSNTTVPTQSVAEMATSTPQPSNTPTEPPPSPTIDPVPTSTVAEVIVAEQEFENGRMFYLQPTDEIFVMTYDDAQKVSGNWQRFPDDWEDTMPEMDEEIVPPAEGLAQPIRGFGFLWRENDEVRGLLGWAIDPEFGHVTNYRYEWDGEVVDGEFIPGPGIHLINSRNPGTTYIFDETNGRWSIAADPSVNQP